MPGSEYQEDSEWMLLWGGLSTWLSRQKAKKGKDLSSCVNHCFLFGHAFNTERVQMSYKTDRCAHRTNATSESWPEFYNSQCDVDL